MSWKSSIKSGILGVNATNDQVKITCRSKEDGAEVYSAINSHYENLGISAPEKVVKGLNYKDFTLKYSSTVKAREVVDALNSVINDPAIAGAPAAAYDTESPVATVASSGSNKKAIIIAAVVGVLVLVGALVFVYKD